MDKTAKTYDNFVKFYSNDKNTTINNSDQKDITGESFLETESNILFAVTLLLGSPINSNNFQIHYVIVDKGYNLV